MSAVAIITMLLSVPAAIVALVSLISKVRGRHFNATDGAPREIVRHDYNVCVFAPSAWLVVSVSNHQTAGLERPAPNNTLRAPNNAPQTMLNPENMDNNIVMSDGSSGNGAVLPV